MIFIIIFQAAPPSYDRNYLNDENDGRPLRQGCLEISIQAADRPIAGGTVDLRHS